MQKLLLTAAVFALAAAGAACGGGGEEEEEANGIRTQMGLSVAAAAQAGARAEERAAGAAGAEAPPGYVSPDEAAAQIVAEAAVGSLEGLTVAGYGVASVDADSAILELYFSTGVSGIPVPGAEEGRETESTQAQTGAITEADLQPVIDAIVAQGVDRDDIELLGGAYYDTTYGSATLRVTVRNLDNLGRIIQAATDAAAGLSDIFLQGSYVSYTVSDCAALERAALRAAKEDADARATALADALGVGRGAIAGAANYAYSPFGGTACETSYAVPYPIGGVRYAEGQASQVQLYATVTVTYEIP